MNIINILAVMTYAIIGGPSVGKTSIVEALSAKGEVTVREASTDIIRERLDKGEKEPWLDSDFQFRVLELQLQREKEMRKDASPLKKARFFVDRGILDGYAYFALRNQIGSDSYKRVDEVLKNLHMEDYYDAVFYVHPHSSKEFDSEKTAIRHEDREESLLISKLIYDVYKKHTSRIIEVKGDMTPKERAEFILSKVEELEKKG